MIISSRRTIVTKHGNSSVNATKKVYSPVIDFKLGTFHIDDLGKEVVKTYPNPTNEFLTMSSDLFNKEYKIYSLLGKEVGSGVLKNKKLMLSHLSVGVYFLKVENYKMAKFVKK